MKQKRKETHIKSIYNLVRCALQWRAFLKSQDVSRISVLRCIFLSFGLQFACKMLYRKVNANESSNKTEIRDFFFCHRVLFCILMWSNLVKWDFFAPVLFIQYRWYGRVSFHIITNIIYSSAICVSIRTLTLFIRFIVFTVSAAPYRFLFGIFFPFSLSIWTKLSMKKSLGHWPVFALVE